jgi:hypothetical protein
VNFHSASNGVHGSPFIFNVDHCILIFGLFLIVFFP